MSDLVAELLDVGQHLAVSCSSHNSDIGLAGAICFLHQPQPVIVAGTLLSNGKRDGPPQTQ